MNKKNIYSRLLKYVGNQRRLLVPAVIMALAGSFCALMLPLITGWAIDRIGVDYGEMVRLLLISAVLLTAGGALEYGCSVLLGRLSARMVRDLRVDGFNKLARLPLKFFDSVPRGELISRMIGDVENISEGILQGVTQLVTGVVGCVGSLVMVFVIDWRIALIVLAISPLYLLLARFIARGSAKHFKNQQDTLGELTAISEEYLTAREAVRAFGLEDEGTRVFTEADRRLYECGWRAQLYSALVNPTSRLVVNLTYAMLGAIGSFAILGGSLTMGLVSSILTYANHFAKPINELSGILTQLQAAGASAGRYFELLDEPEEPEDSSLPALAPGDGRIELRDVSFGYDPGRTLIEHLSLDVPADSMIAIVGPTGAGKTTLVNLLMRYYEPTGGGIYIDGQHAAAYTRDSVRSQFAMVMQETWLFSGTVRDNIAFSRPDATDAEIEQAARRASAHDFIRRMPEEYNTVIDEGGADLSQGQRQLLTIARVMLADAPMLILDEATSSVDTMTELRIQRAFRELMRGRTSFVIAHRLSTIREADLILVMNDGAITERGRHEELMKLNGLYARLVRASRGI